MKKSYLRSALLLALTVVLALGFTACGTGDYTASINVYNWGMYISDGSDGGLDVNAAFTEATGIKVNYTTFDSNETLYTKLKSGGVSYDVICPSDYMVGTLIKENMLVPLNFDNIPNFEKVDERYKGMLCDPEDKYSVPYDCSMVGIIYNTKYVTKEVTGWEIMWDPDYAGYILQFDNPRDAFATAQSLLGISPNTTDPAELAKVSEKLAEQKDLVQTYVMDQVYDLMINEEAWICAYYAGDYLYMLEDNEDLAFCFPEQGFNLFTDRWCIPTCCQNQTYAEMYINFLTSPEISGENMSYLGYGTPVPEAKAYLDPEVAENEIAYPGDEVLSRGFEFASLPDETNTLMSELFNQTKASGSGWSYIPLACIAGAVFLLWLFFFIRKKRRDNY